MWLTRRAVACVVCAAAIATSAAAPAPGRRDAAPGATSAVVAQVEAATAAIRGLRARRAVPVSLLDPASFRRLAARAAGGGASAAAIRDEAQPLVLLGVLPRGTDLGRVLRAQAAGDVAAFYDAGTKRFYIPLRPGGLSLNDRVTIAHEYTHALQDQAFDLGRVRPDPARGGPRDSDRALAATALVEGDANTAMELYAQQTFTQQQYTRYQREAAAAAANVKDNRTPPYLLDGLAFPYDAGALFEERLLSRTVLGVSFAAVDAAFRHPPVSTREILHPEVYLRDPMAPAPNLAPPRPALSAGWRRVDSDVVGEFGLRDMLAQRLDAGTAARAADGWRADRYTLFNQRTDFLMAWRIHTASVAAARVLDEALRAYVARAYHATHATHAAPTPPGSTLVTATGPAAIAVRRDGVDLSIALASRGALAATAPRALVTM